MSDHPPTIIVVHPKERRSKCTAEPLRGRDGFVFWKFPRRGSEPLDGYVRLGVDGPMLSAGDRECGLLVPDGTWRLAGKMLTEFDELPARSLPGCTTAYPRVSKTHDDPPGGLATIEAIWLAYLVLGRETGGLLDGYRWSEEFLAANSGLVADAGTGRYGEREQGAGDRS